MGEAERQQLQRHLDSCGACQTFVAQLDGLGATERSVGNGRATPPDEVTAAEVSSLLDTAISGEPRRPTVSDLTHDPSRRLDRYVLLNRVGRGGMGEVYAAWDPTLDRKVALKLMRAELEEGALGVELRDRLLREAQAMAQLAHPNVVTVHDAGIANDKLFLAMEFVDGINAADWLERAPGWKQVLEIFLQAGDGLAAAHDAGITHRDFKPENVIVSKGGRARVGDFGLAHARVEPKKKPKASSSTESSESSTSLRRAITAPGAILGTPAYMAPEALHGRATDFRSDVFSFCVALYEGLYRQRPFAGTTPAELLTEIESGQLRPPPRETTVPGRFFEVLRRGLSADPLARFSSLGPVTVQLRRARDEGRRRRRVALGVGLVALFTAAAVGLVARDRQRCAQVTDRLDAAWNEQARRDMQQAFLGTGKAWAAGSWRQAESALTEYAAAWRGARRSVCEAKLDDERAARQVLCLGRRLMHFEAVTRLFANADAEVVERAIGTVSSLPSVDGCQLAAPAAPQRAEHDQLRRKLAELQALIDSGKYRGVAEPLQSLAAEASAQDDRGLAAEAATWQAIAASRAGEYTQAAAQFEVAIATAMAAAEAELEATLWIERVGLAALSSVDPAQADSWVRFAQAALQRAPSEAAEAALLNNRAQLARTRGQLADAAALQKQALALRSKLYGPSHPLVSRTHQNLGLIYKAQRRYADAMDEYRLALAADTQSLDESHPAVGEAWNNIGTLAKAEGKLADAQTALERALKIREAAHGADSQQVALTLSNLGAVLLDADRPQRAVEALERALRIKEATAGPQTLTVAITLSNLAEAAQRLQHYPRALELGERALAIREKRLGSTHPELGPELRALASTAALLKDAGKARAFLERAATLDESPAARAQTLTALRPYLTRGADRARAAAMDAELRALPRP